METDGTNALLVVEVMHPDRIEAVGTKASEVDASINAIAAARHRWCPGANCFVISNNKADGDGI